jgi:hypothetical protein
MIVYVCPECQRMFFDGQTHEHGDGVWISTEQIRNYYLFKKWANLEEATV